MVKEIPLKKSGKVTLVDDRDYDMLARHNWRINPDGYVTRSMHSSEGSTTIRMHREIMQAPKGFVVDHINGDPLDNRRENLRLCTSGQNLLNRRKYKNQQAPYKGIIFWQNKWRAQIAIEKKIHFLGCYDTAEQAAGAYNTAAKMYHGEFANLNPVPDYPISRKPRIGYSKHKGVSFSKATGKWIAQHCAGNKKVKRIGNYKTEDEAKNAYDNYVEALVRTQQ